MKQMTRATLDGIELEYHAFKGSVSLTRSCQAQEQPAPGCSSSANCGRPPHRRCSSPAHSSCTPACWLCVNVKIIG
jgi:hypothetical protein